jgi:3-oxoacyl-[acyl-carrier protein] reductase
MEFKGKTAVVTGSSGGIGKAVAVLLAKEGADIVLASRNVAKLEAVNKDIEALGRKVVVIPTDCADDESVMTMKDKALKAFGNIDILINNAGVGIRGSLEDTTMDDWRYIINTNLMGYIRVVQAFLPYFMQRKSGYIVNVSSIQALGYGMVDLNVPYITTKAGIIGFTDALSFTLRPLGIKVSCHIPGGVITEIAHNSRYLGAKERIEELKARDEAGMKMTNVFLSAEQCAAGLLEGMKKEEYLILTPPRMADMLKAQGRDIDMYNAWVANPPPPRMPPPPPR